MREHTNFNWVALLYIPYTVTKCWRLAICGINVDRIRSGHWIPWKSLNLNVGLWGLSKVFESYKKSLKFFAELGNKIDWENSELELGDS